MNSTSDETPSPFTLLEMNRYIVFSIGTIGFFLNLLSVIVLAQPQLKGATFQYMLASSISDTFICLIDVLSLLARCKRFCKVYTTLGVQFFDLYLHYYLGNLLELFSTLIEITLAFDRLFTITGYTKFRKIRPIFILLGLLVFSALFTIPFVLSYKITATEIVTVDDSTNATWSEVIFDSNEYSDFGASQTGVVVLSVFSAFRGVFLVVALTAVNIVMIVKLKGHVRKKKSIVFKPSMSCFFQLLILILILTIITC